MDCLKVKDPEEYNTIQMLYKEAVAQTQDPDFVRVAPPPKTKPRII